MKNKEVVIGRQVDESGLQVDEQYTMVGRRHARLYRTPDGIYIEDLDTKNGTFVNGTLVARKKVSATDKIMLGGANYYELNLDKAMKMLSLPQHEFQAAFQELKQVEENHEKEEITLEVTKYKKMALKRHSPAAIMTTITIFFTAFVGDDPCLRNTIAIVGGLISLFLFYKSIEWESRSRKDMMKQQKENNKKFYMKYACPDCWESYNGKPWEHLNNMGKCPYCKRAFH